MNDGGEMFIEHLAVRAASIVQLHGHVMQSEDYVFQFDVHTEASQGSRSLENCVHPTSFTGG